MTPALATVVRRATDDGLLTFAAHVPIGQVYVVDLDTMRSAQLLNLERQVRHWKLLVSTTDGDGALPVECLLLTTVAGRA